MPDIPWRPGPVLGDVGHLEKPHPQAQALSTTQTGEDTSGHRHSQTHGVRNGLKGGTEAGAAPNKERWLYLGVECREMGVSGRECREGCLEEVM